MAERQRLSARSQALVGRATVAYSVRNRARKARRISQIIVTQNLRSVLLVGAETATFSWSNIVERAVIDSGAWVVVSGLGPTLEFPVPRVVCNGLFLPFPDDCFDLVISNAVIEHVGPAVDQRKFVAEHARVGRSFIITTPNRWCPVESHTRTLFQHWSARWRDSRTEFTRLLSRAELRALLPAASTIRGHAASPTYTATWGLGTAGAELTRAASDV